MIREKDGIHIERETGYVMDSRTAVGDINFVSHAHSDHAFKDGGEIVCSDLTSRILRERFGSEVERREHANIQLLRSGHILGSSAALIEDEVLYTGDVSTRDRSYIKGFEPVKAEKLVVEATYGVPAYTFPDQKDIEESIRDWVRDTEETLFLSAYSLGKAQKIQHIVQEAAERPIVAHKAVVEMNKVIEENTDLGFRARKLEDNKELLEENGIAVVPSHLFRSDYVKKLVEKYDGVTAGFSGWAVNSSMGYGKYDRSFPFSDHCDFNELVELVEQVDPEEVYTHHGFDEAFASYLRKEKGFNARSLKKNQASLTDF